VQNRLGEVFSRENLTQKGVNMTIKKIGLSMAVMTALASSAFAGTLVYSDGSTSAKIASELYQLDNNVTVNLGTSTRYMEYTASLDGSGTVSDAAINLIFSSVVTKPSGYKFVIADESDGNKTIAKEINYDSATGKVTFDSDSQYTIADGKKYIIALTDGNVNLDDTLTAGNIQEAQVSGSQSVHTAFGGNLEVWSTSGTETLRDTASMDFFTVVPQYKVTCDNKFNNLINVENSSLTFVSTKHGVLNDANGSSGDIAEVLSDIMRFTVTKTAVDFGLDGNGSVMSLSADNNTTFATAIAAGTTNFADDTGVVAINALGDATTEVNATDTFSLPSTFYGLGASTHTYTVNLKATGLAAIPATKFTGNFYIRDNRVDSNTTYTPADPSYSANTAAGEWAEFAYIAQIPSATTDSAVETKLKVVNRSCKDVTPIFKLVKDGVVTTVKAPSIVAVDSQVQFKLSDIVAKAIDEGASISATGQYALEVTIPGNAEDFYVYAQSKNVNVGQFKDLPVYNTSTRNY